MKKRTGSIFVSLLISSIFLIGCRTTTLLPTDPAAPTEAQPTVTVAPAATIAATATVEPTSAPSPTPTPQPTIAPMRIFLSDMERMAAVYPSSVVIQKAEETSLVINPSLGISFKVPVSYALQVQSAPQNRTWELIGGGLLDDRLLSLSIGTFPADNAPSQAEILSWNSPNPAGSLSTSEELIEFENGFGVLFTELYPYKGHYGMDVIYTLVLSYDDIQSIGIEYFLSEEIYAQSEIDVTIAEGVALVKSIQESYTQVDGIEGVAGLSEFRLLTGICPTDQDETYGYSQENPILITSFLEDPVTAALRGPAIIRQYFDTLLFDGQPISYVWLGSISTEDTILDEYQITLSNGDRVVLYVDQYESAPYRVPVGFECMGILNPEFLIEFEEKKPKTIQVIFFFPLSFN